VKVDDPDSAFWCDAVHCMAPAFCKVVFNVLVDATTTGTIFNKQSASICTTVRTDIDMRSVAFPVSVPAFEGFGFGHD